MPFRFFAEIDVTECQLGEKWYSLKIDCPQLIWEGSGDNAIDSIASCTSYTSDKSLKMFYSIFTDYIS